MKNKECNDAINRLFLNIDINEIKDFIDNIECISDIRKEFYKNILEQRYNILEKIYVSLNT